MEDAREPARPAGRWIAAGAAAVVLAAIALRFVASAPLLVRIPAAYRPAVVERALANLREVCQAADRPRDFCAEQAKLLAGRPECDEACQAVVREELEVDTALR